jgi:hypothetical protein
MWDKRYQDYPEDSSLKSQQVEAGKGIIGCEMKEICGYGLTQKKPRSSSGWLSALFSLFVSLGKKK